MQREVVALEKELKERQGVYIKRERVYRMRIDELTVELSDLRRKRTQWLAEDPNMQNLRDIHGELQRSVGLVQIHAAKVVHEQEKEMLATFRKRLLDVQSELEKEKAKKYDGASAWIERARQLELDVEKERDRADALDRGNQALGLENGRLKQAFELQEDDRAFLVRQLVAVRDENERVRTSIQQNRDMEAELRGSHRGASSSSSSSSSSFEAAKGGASLPQVLVEGKSLSASADGDAAYRAMIKKLRRMLDVERKHIAQVKAAHEHWAALRTPLELSLREAAAEAAKHVALRHASAALVGDPNKAKAQRRDLLIGRNLDFDTATLAQFDHDDRQKMIELWLSMDGVLDTLYAENPADFNREDTPAPYKTNGGDKLKGHQPAPSAYQKTTPGARERNHGPGLVDHPIIDNSSNEAGTPRWP